MSASSPLQEVQQQPTAINGYTASNTTAPQNVTNNSEAASATNINDDDTNNAFEVLATRTFECLYKSDLRRDAIGQYSNNNNNDNYKLAPCWVVENVVEVKL